MLLQDWMNENQSYPAQALFVRDRIAALFCSGLSPENGDHLNVFKNVVQVISTHRSHSVSLPVYSLTREDIGLRIVLRNNGYNWKLSVISDKPITADLTTLFHTKPPTKAQRDWSGDDIASCYFEGFPEDLIFRYMSQNSKKFSACISGDNELWTTLFLILSSLGIVQPRKYSEPR